MKKAVKKFVGVCVVLGVVEFGYIVGKALLNEKKEAEVSCTNERDFVMYDLKNEA